MNSIDIDVVVSFATHKARIDKGQIYQFLDSIVSQEYNGRLHIVANIWKPDYDLAPQKLKDYFNEHNIEVYLSEINYRTFLKSCHSFEKYENIPIITVDDDMIYKPDMIQQMMNTHNKYPNEIIAGFCKAYQFNEKGLINWDQCPTIMSGLKPGFINVHPIGLGGILYPPCFYNKITVDEIQKWMEKQTQYNKYNDDKFMYDMSVKFDIRSIPVISFPIYYSGYLVEKPLAVCHDETAGTWKQS